MSCKQKKTRQFRVVGFRDTQYKCIMCGKVFDEPNGVCPMVKVKWRPAG